MEAVYFDDGVRTAKRQQLESKLLQVIFFFLLTFLNSKNKMISSCDDYGMAI